MPPEQARGEIVDERADVYAIGAVLYELLAGAPPYAGDTPRDILDRVLTTPPRPLADAAPGVPADLIAIVHKAMSRNPDQRYPTARELAADLRRYATGQLVTAHHYGTMLLARRWLRRHRAPVAVAAVAAVTVVAVAAMSFGRVVEERNAAQTERGRAVDEARRAEDRQAELVRLQARTSLRRDPTAAIAWLKAYPSTAPHQEELADVLDEARALGVARHVLRHREWVQDAVFSPDGTSVATACKDGGIRIFDLQTGAGRELGHQSGGVESVAFSPDGKWIAASGDRIMMWPIDGGPPKPLLAHSDTMIGSVRFSPDGSHLLAVRERDPLLVIEVADPDERSEVQVPRESFRIAYAADEWTTVLAASVDGVISTLLPRQRQIAKLPRGVIAFRVDRTGRRYVGYDGETVWQGDVAGGPPVALGRFAGGVQTVVLEISPDGRWIALGNESHDIWLYDTAARKERTLRGHTDAMYSFAFARDGRRMVSASDDATARVWDLLSGDSIALRGHEDDVMHARFSPDDAWIATASIDGTARIWDVRGGDVRLLGPDDGPIYMMKTQPNNVVITSGPGFASRWDLATGKKTSFAAAPPSGPRMSYWKNSTPLMTPDGSVVASIGDGDTVQLQVGAQRRVLTGHSAWITTAQMAEDGSTLYTGSRDGTVREWDTATGVGKLLYQSKDENEPVRAMALAENGTLAFQADGGIVEIARDGKATRLGGGTAWCTRFMEFDELDRLLLFRCSPGTAVYRPGEGVVELRGNNQAVKVVVSPDGTRYAGAMTDRTVVVWDAATGRQIAVLRGHTDLVLNVAWSPDGKRIASASYDHTVRVWDVERTTSRVLRGHGSAVDTVAWLDNGERLISGSRDATIRIWSAPPRDPPTPADVRAELAKVTTARIGFDDKPAT
jgi:WD40 repeat protein